MTTIQQDDEPDGCEGCCAAILLLLMAAMFIGLVVMWGRVWTVDQRLERIEQKLEIPAEKPDDRNQPDGGCIF